MSRFSSAFFSLAVVGFLAAACGPAVEVEDDFIEEQCTHSCERLDECGRRSEDCLDVCSKLVTWEPESCEELTAEYLQCLRELTCEESAARAEAIENGERPLPPMPCDAESLAAAACTN
ncbi:MAG: hypothetical protein KUG77_18500 [Nannocystaceae bacterium]|nr:hypothetical protein [Nannocystaceae bacterium]